MGDMGDGRAYAGIEPLIASPPDECWLHGEERIGVREGRKTWRNRQRKRFYQWDATHGEVEVYDEQGRHRGVLAWDDPDRLIKPAKAGRRINV